MTFSNLQASGPETFPQLRTRVSSCLERAGVSEFGTFLPCPPRRAMSGFRGNVLQNSLLR